MTGENIIVLDLETQKSFKEVGGKSNLQRLKVSVVGVYDYKTDEYKTYEEKECLELDKRLKENPVIIGFNVRRFDMPVLAPYLFKPIEDFQILDLLDVIEKERGHRASLDSIAGPTLKQRKSGHGADAIVLYQEGKMKELKSYCLDDVRLTRDIYEKGCEEGKILFTSGWDYKTYEIPVNWKEEIEQLLKASRTEENVFPTSLF